MIMFSERQWRIFNRIRRKYKVSLEFLNYNMPNILRFIAYYGQRLHFILKRTAERNPRNQAVIIKYNRLMRSLFDEEYRKRIKRRKRNIKQWSKKIVLYLRKTKGVKEYTIIKKMRNSVQKRILPEEITKQMKEQLELLRSGKRSTQLIESCELPQNAELKSNLSTAIEVHNDVSENATITGADAVSAEQQEKTDDMILNEKTGVLEINPIEKMITNTVVTDISTTMGTTNPNPKSNSNILDLLMRKVGGGAQTMPKIKRISSTSLPNTGSENDTEMDSGEEFLGFAEDENIPGLMRTPLVPAIFRSKDENVAFVSEALDEYFRENFNRSDCNEQSEKLPCVRKLRQSNIDGLMTMNPKPPAFDMPAVPETLQKLRTVAERRQYLQKFSRNMKMAIINNEAAIYRELQRKLRQPKTKIFSQQAMQSNSSQMSFTRLGWQAASFVSTELNKFFYQKLFLPNEKMYVELRGVRGNNNDLYKTPYVNKLTPKSSSFKCTVNCADCCIAKHLQPISTYSNRKKLCKEPFRAIFKPCPLSHKPRQKLMDDDEILLRAGGMTVVPLPTVELQVQPEIGKPFNDIAKRYLHYILPHEKITRVWAEFSTSTLQTPTRQEETKKSENILKTYNFTVPYANDRSHILVRRIVNHSEEIDPFFLRDSNKNENMSDLSFCANIDKRDSIQVECASLLADMINSVALSNSENSFIKEDVEAFKKFEDCYTVAMKEKTLDKPTTKQLSTQKTISGPKKSRLISELRRLNATIIETNAQHKNDIRLCPKEFCALGCICLSLSNGYPLQQHCGKAKCMLQCVCKSPTPSKILCIETDGRSITTEDAYNMRLQATARLARIEKEFTSTIVVTENETLLINETEYDKKRRCTKVPKRYQDYRDSDTEYGRISPFKSHSNTPVTDLNESRNSPAPASASSFSEIMDGLPERIYVKDAILNQLKHCSIPLIPFRETHNMTVWCMVHQMYKCFCGGHALEGKRVIIEKEDPKSVSGLTNDINQKLKYSSKAYYSFESKEEYIAPKEESSSLAKKRKISNDHKRNLSEEKDMPPPPEKLFKKNVEYDFLIKYFKDRDYVGCGRIIPVPSRTYKSINRKRRAHILGHIDGVEDTASQLLLNEHIMRSVYYHNEKQKIEKAAALENAQIKREDNFEEIKEEFKQLIIPLPKKMESYSDIKHMEPEPEPEPEDNENNHSSQLDNIENNIEKNKGDDEQRESQTTISQNDEVRPVSAVKRRRGRMNKKSKESLLKNCKKSFVPIDGNTSDGVHKDNTIEETESNLNPKGSQSKTNDNETNVEKKLKKSENNESKNVNNDMTTFKVNENTLSLPKDNESIPSKQPQNDANTASALPHQGGGGGGGGGISSMSDDLRGNYNEVIKMLNNLVSRKMHDIDNALKRDSKIVPPPTENVLCVLQWKNFLGAFQDGLIYIWEVKMKTRTFLAATVLNIIPMVLGALAVISITHTPLQQLPLLGQMLLSGYKLKEDTLDLAVIMQGRSHYWFIKGFLQPNVGGACLRPTPETHPELTKKINNLCSTLVKHRSKEFQRRDQLIKRKLNKANKISSSVQEQDEKNKRGREQLVTTVSSTFNNLMSSPPNSCELLDAEKNKILNIAEKVRQKNWKTNIDLHQPPDLLDNDNIQIPETYENDHKWYILDLCNDFSHIFVPIHREIVSLDRIQRLIALSGEKQKVIRIQFLKRSYFDAFIVPTSKRKMYFGPFALNAEPPLLVLLQSVDGKMMTREAYQTSHNIQPKSSMRTTSFWLKQINGQICLGDEQQQENSVSVSMEENTSNEIALGNPSHENENCEDDCIIIENENDSYNQRNELATSPLSSLSKNLQEVDMILKQIKSLDNTSKDAANGNATNIRNSSPSLLLSNFNTQTKNTRMNELESIALEDSSKQTIESINISANSKEDSAEKQAAFNQIRKQQQTLPSFPNISVDLLNKKPGIVSSVDKLQISSGRTIASKIITNFPATSNMLSVEENTIQLTQTQTQQSVNTVKNPSKMDLSLDGLKGTHSELNRSVIFPPNSRDNNSLFKSSAVESIFINKSTTPSYTTQNITVKNAAPNACPTKLAIAPVTSTLTSGALTSTSTGMIKSHVINKPIYNTPTPRPSIYLTQSPIKAPMLTPTPTPTPTPQFFDPLSTQRPTESYSVTKNVKAFSSGGSNNEPQLPKVTNSAYSGLTSTTQQSLLKVLKKPSINVQTVTTTSNSTNMTESAKGIIPMRNLNPTPINTDPLKTTYRITPTSSTTYSANAASSFPVKLKALAQQPNSLIEHPRSTTTMKISSPMTINCSTTKTLSTLSVTKPISTAKIPSANLAIPTTLGARPTNTNNSAAKDKYNITSVTFEPVFGYLSSNLPELPRFLTKKTQFEYLIKVPGFGLAKALGLQKANNFLNKHVARTFKIPVSNNRIVWHFVPQQVAANTKNKAAIDREQSQQQAKTAIRRPTTSTSTASTVSNPKLIFNKQTNQQQPSQVEQTPPTLTKLLGNLNETILIDDDE